MKLSENVSLFNTENEYYKLKYNIALENKKIRYPSAPSLPNTGTDMSRHVRINNMRFLHSNDVFSNKCPVTKEAIFFSSPSIMGLPRNCKLGYLYDFLYVSEGKYIKDSLIYIDFLLQMGKENSFYISTVGEDAKPLIELLKTKFIISYINEVKIGYGGEFQYHIGIVNHHSNSIYPKREMKRLEKEGMVITKDPIEGVPEYYNMDISKKDKEDTPKVIKTTFARQTFIAKCTKPTKTLTRDKNYRVTTTYDNKYRLVNDHYNMIYVNKERLEPIE